MNFQEQIQQIFGTTDIYELKQISRDADNYRCLKADMNNSIISEKKKIPEGKIRLQKNSWHIFWHCRTGRKNYRYCQTVSRFPSDDLQSDKASL